jgi:hypothetical protein
MRPREAGASADYQLKAPVGPGARSAARVGQGTLSRQAADSEAGRTDADVQLAGRHLEGAGELRGMSESGGDGRRSRDG